MNWIKFGRKWGTKYMSYFITILHETTYARRTGLNLEVVCITVHNYKRANKKSTDEIWGFLRASCLQGIQCL